LRVQSRASAAADAAQTLLTVERSFS